MTAELSRDEQRFLDDLLTWNEKTRGTELLLSHLALAAGGGVLVVTAVVTLRNLTDATVIAVLVPGFVAGLFLIGVYAWIESRIRDRHRIVVLARKLSVSGT